jgi:hypothetical protein
MVARLTTTLLMGLALKPLRAESFAADEGSGETNIIVGASAG